MVKVDKGRMHGSYHCGSCGLPEIDLDKLKRKEDIQLWHISIGRPHTSHTSTSVLCWDCLNNLYAQVGIQVRREL